LDERKKEPVEKRGKMFDTKVSKREHVNSGDEIRKGLARVKGEERGSKTKKKGGCVLSRGGEGRRPQVRCSTPAWHLWVLIRKKGGFNGGMYVSFTEKRKEGTGSGDGARQTELVRDFRTAAKKRVCGVWVAW